MYRLISMRYGCLKEICNRQKHGEGGQMFEQYAVRWEYYHEQVGSLFYIT